MTSAPAANVLYFRDAAPAADQLGQALHTSAHTINQVPDAGTFQAELATGNYQLAVFTVLQQDAAQFAPAINALGQWVAGGGRALYFDWSGNATLAAPFQANFTSATDLQRVTVTDATLAASLSRNPIDLRKTFWFRTSRGLAPLAGGTVLATFENGHAAVIRGNGGRSLVYGFASDAPANAETFASGLALLLGEPVAPRAIEALNVANVTPNSATLLATVRPGDLVMGARFEFGRTNSYGRATPTQTFPAGSGASLLMAEVGGLAGHRTYHFRARSLNAAGTVISEDATFTTANTPPTATDRAVPLGPGGAVTIDLLAEAADADGDTLSLASLGTPSTGTVVSRGSGAVTYTKGPGFGSSDVFTYTVADGFGGTATGTLTVFFFDADNDGAPDEWETLYGFDPNDPNDAALDPDGDGATNRAEFLAGTNPLDAASRFAVDEVTRDALGRAVIVFTARPSRSYTVQAADTLGPNRVWLKLLDVPARATTETVSVADSAVGVPERFYRVVTPALP